MLVAVAISLITSDHFGFGPNSSGRAGRSPSGGAWRETLEFVHLLEVKPLLFRRFVPAARVLVLATVGGLGVEQRDGFKAPFAGHFRRPPDRWVPRFPTAAGSARAVGAVRIRPRMARSSAAVSRFHPAQTPSGRCRTFGRIRRNGTDRSTSRASCRMRYRGGLPGKRTRHLRHTRLEDVRKACRRPGKRRSRIAFSQV